MTIGPCEEWPGARQGDGYGVVRHEGKVVLVHRLAWAREHGPIPDGMHVLHECDNPPCRRLSHLFLGTPLDNARDKFAKGRARVLGVENVNAKLTDDAVRDIRARRDRGEPIKLVGAAHGIDPSTVVHIHKRRRWAHVA